MKILITSLFPLLFTLTLQPLYAAQDAEKTMKELAVAFQGIEGITMTKVDQVIFISGECATPEAVSKVNLIASSLGDSVKSFVVLSKGGREKVAGQLERMIGSKEVLVTFANNAIMLEGVAESSFEADRAVELAKTFLDAYSGEAGSFGARTPGSSDLHKSSDPYPHNSAYGTGAVVVDMLRIKPSSHQKKK